MARYECKLLEQSMKFLKFIGFKRASFPITFILLLSVFAGAVLVRAQDVQQSIGTNGTVIDSKPKEEQLPFSVEKINIEGGA
ncbi:MAG: hypothetical protein ACJ72Z_06750, partial [Pyrinomonadaceae bacterium]